MAKITRLASTLTARYFPSQHLTDAFYMDGRLFGKREVRNADITLDKEEKGFFFSVFSHPTIQGYEPGMMPPYEPQLREICNQVKFSHKEIDAMISGFLSTAVEVTGKMRLQDNESRAPYFAGVIVNNAEAFAVTIGSGLAFLYRNDTLYPLTDAGVPMEPIDAFGNRVGDFYTYVSSKTANALWSNITTLSVDDCIILCNREVYEALGQRELLRILDEAEDQCDAAGTVITQASANAPQVPMQFSISFVESITADEKKGLFGRRKKQKEEDTSDLSIKSNFDTGVVGAAAEAIAGAGFASGYGAAAATAASGVAAEAVSQTEAVVFGDSMKSSSGPVPPTQNQEASTEEGLIIDSKDEVTEASVEFLDKSVTEVPTAEVSAEEMMKNLFGEMKTSSESDKLIQQKAEDDIKAESVKPEETLIPEISKEDDSKTNVPFNPFAMPLEEMPVAETVVPAAEEETVVPFNVASDDEATKTVTGIDALLSDQYDENGNLVKDGIIAAALREMKDEKKAEEVVEDKSENISEVAPVSVNKDGDMVFTADSGVSAVQEASVDATNPYAVGSAEAMQTAAPLIFESGDDSDINENGGTSKMDENNMNSDDNLSFTWDEKGAPQVPIEDEIPVPDFNMVAEEKPEEIGELPIDFPSVAKEEPVPVQPASNEETFVLPFENAVVAEDDQPKSQSSVEEDIPEMPVYGSNTYDAPTYAVNSDEQVGNIDNSDAYIVGGYANDDVQAVPEADASNAQYTDYGNEGYGFDSAAADASAGYAEGYNQGYGYDAQPQASEGYDAFGVQSEGYDQQYVDNSQGYDNTAYDGQYGEGYAYAPDNGQDAQTESSGDDWIDSILGIDDSAPYAGAAAGVATGVAGAAAYGAASAPTQSRPGGQARPTGNGQRPNSSNGGRGGYGGNGRGTGAGGGKKRPRLSRNGIIFLGFCAAFLICLIIVICLIVNSCNDKKAKATETTVPSEPTTITIATTESTTPDPTAPIGVFVFSDYTGYRTWWDLFNNVYNVQLESETDDRVAKIIEYNNLSADYTPHSGDMLLLPPVGVLNGSIPLNGETPASSEADSTDGQIGEPQIGGETDEGETTTAAPEEA